MCAYRSKDPKYFNDGNDILAKIIFGCAYFTLKNLDS